MLSILVVLAGCKSYDPKDYIGLTSKEIVEKYGEFDVERSDPSADGLFRKCGCGYTVVPERVGFFGTTPPKYFMIYFDNNGIAFKCVYETGGWGG